MRWLKSPWRKEQKFCTFGAQNVSLIHSPTNSASDTPYSVWLFSANKLQNPKHGFHFSFLNFVLVPRAFHFDKVCIFILSMLRHKCIIKRIDVTDRVHTHFVWAEQKNLMEIDETKIQSENWESA